jgi:hypothetical protein
VTCVKEWPSSIFSRYDEGSFPGELESDHVGVEKEFGEEETASYNRRAMTALQVATALTREEE